MTTNSTITPEVLDQLLANYEKPEDLLGGDGLFKQLKKALIERALGAELTEHLGYEKGDPAGRGSGNSRNGSSSKTVLTEDGEIGITVPRDRAGSFEPQLIAKGQTRFDGFDDKILSLYARGMTVREIQGHLLELYGTEVSPDLISRVTHRGWQRKGSASGRQAARAAAHQSGRTRGGGCCRDVGLLRVPAGALAAHQDQQPARAHPARDPAAHARCWRLLLMGSNMYRRQIRQRCGATIKVRDSVNQDENAPGVG